MFFSLKKSVNEGDFMLILILGRNSARNVTMQNISEAKKDLKIFLLCAPSLRSL